MKRTTWRRLLLLAVMFHVQCALFNVYAQITIAGDVYGGGREGAVGTGFAVNVVTATDAAAWNAVHPSGEQKVVTPAEDVKLTGDTPTDDVTKVTINSGTIRSVFGGGQDGRTYGSTNVTVRGKSTQIGLEELKNTVYGGLFGAGDGAPALVFGNSRVTIEGGYIVQKVYGGGNQADLMGHTQVTLLGGNIRARGVFGGARMANIFGYSYVLIDGEKLKNDLLVNYVYGGNDVSGTIESNDAWAWTTPDPNAPDDPSSNMKRPFLPKTNGVDNTWDAFVRLTNPDKADGTGKKIYIGQLFGGGNGDYTYTDNGTKVTIPLKEWNSTTGAYETVAGGKTFTVNGTPTLTKTYLEIGGGSIVYAYGGGNNATVTDQTVICVDNPSEVVNSIKDANNVELLTNARFEEMGINLNVSYPSSDAYQIGSFYGGNNKAEMAIRPTWNLISGKIRNIYSGGNAGNMTSPVGLLLPLTSAGMKVESVYGGCRMANVIPTEHGVEVTDKALVKIDPYVDAVSGKTYNFPDGYAARVLITAGNIDYVYGGNDISGRVKFGNAIGIHSSINKDVYGGGNGSYVYTDNSKLANNAKYGDFYYAPGTNSAAALNAFRPNAESVSIHVDGTPGNRTIIGGSLYCGGNSATLTSGAGSSIARLEMGRHVIAENVFLGNNGEHMIDPDIIKAYLSGKEGDEKLSTINLTDANVFATYMEGVDMSVEPTVTFDPYFPYDPDDPSNPNNDDEDYTGGYDTYIGSYFCGGNVGSMSAGGTFDDLVFNQPAVIYNKLVAGCNKANVEEIKDADNSVIISPHYHGGLITPTGTTAPKVKLDLQGIKLMPLKLMTDATTGSKKLAWNVVGADGNPLTTINYLEDKADDGVMNPNYRLLGANVYGGCYTSGHVDGSVLINIDETLVERDKIFAQIVERPKLYSDVTTYPYTPKTGGAVNSGVILDEQGMDVLGSALNVFGGGYGKASEIWGSTTVYLNKGYTFQIFGGGEEGPIGETDNSGKPIANEDHSTYIHLNGTVAGEARGGANDDDMADCEFIYGGGFAGPVAGSTHIYLNNGRIFNSFAGCCNADVLGHTETYVGKDGFPWVRDHIYGGNDLGGKIGRPGSDKDFSDRVSDNAKSKSYNTSLMKAYAYVEYIKGRVENIFGGCYGVYDYTDEFKAADGYGHPRLENAFVNFKPVKNANSFVSKIFGAGQGGDGDRLGDKIQDFSYVLVDSPQDMKNFSGMEVFGAGAYNGIGMNTSKDAIEDFDKVSAVTDLISGVVGAAYGASYNQGVTRRTVVNVPDGSTIKIGSIFGGAYGTQILPPCDVYESNVNYHSSSAALIYDPGNVAYDNGIDELQLGSKFRGAIYGGNNNERRTLFTKVNINVPVVQERIIQSGDLAGGVQTSNATVYGAGRGVDTWAEHTEVNLLSGAKVYEVYGGGEMGHVLNAESIQKYIQLYKGEPSPQIASDDPGWATRWNNDWAAAWKDAWTLGDYFDPKADFSNDYSANAATNLDRVSVREELKDDAKTTALLGDGTAKFNTNVILEEGAEVVAYAYGGGLGDSNIPMSGDIYGMTYFAMLGGTVGKDLYAAGTSGGVYDIFGAGFTPSANAYIKGGQARNVYGGGWRGNVGSIDASGAYLSEGETRVVVGKVGSSSAVSDYANHPYILRNVYGGGEGGSIYGTSHVTVNDGHIGYRYKSGAPVEELDDAPDDNMLDTSGNVFGGGYVANSYTDFSDITMYGGIVRGCLYGGGEIGPIGRGTVKDGPVVVQKYGGTHVTMYGGQVLRNVFGGGRGKDNWGGDGTAKLSAAEKANMDLSSKGYIFGSTDVNIHRGEVGTVAGVNKGYGNVFGGGDLGFVYGDSQKAADGYYYKGGNLSEDCRVNVEAYGVALQAFDTFQIGDPISNAYLNKLTNSDSDASKWNKIDQTGITIHNGVFAGGNVTSGSSDVFAFSKTIFGNATASVVDVFCRDLISVGGDGVGGIYGDGNLTYVDGYRELNISNYGTDFYALPSSLDMRTAEGQAAYNKLTDRQKDIYVVKYQFDGNQEGNVRGLYMAGDVILSDEYNKLTDTQKQHWTAIHSVINEGRYINTVQRCDFCGIIGSRMVLRGAMDRAQDNNVAEADYTNYTINRVGELSLNQWHYDGTGAETHPDHGCYFGIYNVVKLLGAVTSDVKFDDTRVTTSTLEANKADGKTYWQWKQAHKADNNVNNGESFNKIALASGVYLDIVKDFNDDGSKVYGPITGVVELDLLNVTPGEGGGYVYAENIHGVRSTDEAKAIAHVLSAANRAQGGCRTNAGDTYSPAGANDDLETSGNFVSSLKNIVDDCFPTSKSWMTGGAPAHYWYIRGEFYVYDQEVSAYTGSADAYSAEISIPLTMVAQSNARLRILNVLPGLYADPTMFDPAKSYYDADLGSWKSDSLEIVYDNVTKRFGQNDPISYWDWYMTNKANQSRFVTETYTCIEQVTVGGTTYYPGQGILPETYNSLLNVAGTDIAGGRVDNAQEKFRITNGMSRDNGYVLTLDMSNPGKWNDYYTKQNDNTDKKSTYEYNNLTDAQKANYVESATFRCNESGTYGQYYFNEGDITSQAVYEMETSVEGKTTTTQATFVRAYVAKDSCEVTIAGEPRIMQKNATIPASTYNALNAADKAHFTYAKVCGSTFNDSGSKELYIAGQVIPDNSPVLSGSYGANFSDAWYCTSEGSWGGQYYQAGQNYSGVNYCQLLPEERQHFSYNYDAFDLMVADFTQNGESYPSREELARAGTEHNRYMPLYDGSNAEKLYSQVVYVDYDAIYKGTSSFTYKPDSGSPVVVSNGTRLQSADYQNLPNDYTHFSTISVNDNHKQPDGSYKTYVVKKTFDVGGKMYNAGKTITGEDFDGLGQFQENVDVITMTAAQHGNNTTGLFYYCIDEYQVGNKDKYIEGYTSSTLYDINNREFAKGSTVPVGTIVSSSKMSPVNYQSDFEVSGEIPTEQTMLYVPVSADYNELQKDRYITVIFEYTYTESDAQGLNYETRVEKHILNLRVKFKSGKPVIGKLKEPPYVLPLETVEIGIPFIQENASAFPILKGGFEIYDNETDALKHRNGREFVSNSDPVYFYEDMNYVAYYAESRLGRTYSDPVPIHVANYQRMSDVITDPEHMYINHRLVKRNPKIYIDNRKVSGQTYNELDAMKELFDIVNGDYGRVADDNTEKNHGRDVLGAKGLDFFVQDDVATTRPWTSIGNATNCFEGNFHGNGHTLSGLDNSLFGKLCGNVYNVGVMGTFTGGGVAESGGGRIENAWVSTTGAPTGKAIMTNPTDAVIVNSYYPETQAFTAYSGTGFDVTKRPVSDFRNGRVAYDLNRYYLEARYNLFTSDGNVNGNPVKGDSALFRMPDGSLEHTTTTSGDTWPVTHGLFYTDDYAWHKGVGAGNTEKKYGYVESLYEDGDFRFSDGLKPQTSDMRLTQYSGYMPIFPDDYIFFGQRLSYGLYTNRNHNDVPMGVAKEHTFLDAQEAVDNSKSGLLTDNVQTENRVYRAPAYFQNGVLGKSAMFNANAAFAATYGGMDIYPNMTAIDFSGGNGDTNGSQGVVPGVEADFTDKAHGYGPLLDFIRIDDFRTAGLTQNLLAYAPDEAIANTMNVQTATALKNWSGDLAYAEGTSPAKYRTVAVQDASDVKGHVIQKSGTAYYGISDQYLVDKQDFNAPMAYTLKDGFRMWYQRQPDNYVELDKGWEAVSLPFTAELVTTQDKGEISHFYKGSETGHEYWLRSYKGGAKSTTNDNIFVATMNKLDAGTEYKNYTNTFLWDYYYSKDEYKDMNSDKYQKEYYKDSHIHDYYPYLQNGNPYIIGFPGQYYYEFDLSGQWMPKYRIGGVSIDNPGKQTVTFASATGIKIGVSDSELSGGKVKADGYTFVPNYLGKSVAAGAGYLLNGTGSSFVKNAAAATTVPFRPYFVSASGSGARTREADEIVFSQDDSKMGDHGNPSKGEIYGTLKITAKKHKIVVESSLSYETEVCIYTPAGIALKTFTIKPDETIETLIVNQGVYIVQTSDTRYTKKLTVR